jgi:Tfp pilus assembly protein PilN
MRPVNLVPQDQRRRVREDSSGKGAYVALGVLTALLALVVAYVMTTNQVTERKNEAAALSAEADRLEAKAAKEASYTDFAQIAQTRLVSVAGVAETRFDWERLMREVSLIMPEGSWLQSTDASVLGDPTATTTPAPAPAPTTTTTTTVAPPVSPAATFVGCTPRQTDVARMMVRLRQMHRVSDVELNESAQEESTSPATVDNCGSYYKYDLTVTFSPTEPASERPRGATRVPASLGGGS